MTDGFARNAVRISNGVQDNEANVINTNGFNALVATAPGHVSTINSTATLLTADSVFTGTFENITNFGVIIITLKASHASATDGLMVEFSSDGTNVDSNDVFTIPADTGKTFSFQAATKFFRVNFTNSSSNQTSFRLQTILKPYYVKPSSHRLQDNIVDQDDAELVKAVITGKDPDNIFRNVNITVDGDLKISNNSSGLSIAKGDVTGSAFVHKFGNAPDFDAADNAVTVWDGSADATAWELMNYVYSTTADIDSISSSSVDDTVDIVVEGLDSNFDLSSQTVTLNGQTRVALSTSLIRIFRAYNDNSTNLVGNVFIYVNGALTGGVPNTNADIRAIIDPANQQTEMAIYTIPNAKTGYLRDWYAATSGANRSTNYVIKLIKREDGKVFRLFHTSAISETGTSSYQHKYEEPEVFPAKTDIEMTAQVTAAGVSAATVSAGFDIVLIDD